MSAMHPDPEEGKLREAFTALDPGPAQVRRVEAALMKALDDHPPSLIEEWLGLLTARPIVNTAYLLAATAVLLVTTPLGSLASLLLRGLG
ncbi:MAG: hypothetical protein ACYC8T_01255 [Myxococcaceae bacterium]